MHRTMQISEIFHSLQGEGPWLGMPATFIRLSGCIEPHCPWCDTPYALKGGNEMTIEAILQKVRDLHCSRIVITGGEPFLQWSKGLKDLHERLLQDGHQLQYETSGKIELPPLDNAVVVGSPKFIHAHWHYLPANTTRIDYFKFIADKEKACREILDFIAKHRIPSHKVYIMPLGHDRDTQLSNMPAIFDFCVNHGFRMTPRLHILTFDTRKGV